MKEKLTFSKIILGMQMLFVAFGALVLVPILTGLDACVALFTAGLGTIAFQFITKFKVPVFLASSFAFIAPISEIVKKYGVENHVVGIQTAQGAIIVAGIVQLLFAFIIYKFGIEKINKYLPPIVVGPTIMVIGLGLSTVAVDMASGKMLKDIPMYKSLIVAFVSLLTAVYVNIKGKGLLKLIPIICGIITGYITAYFFNMIDFSIVSNAKYFQIPSFTFPRFELNAVLYMLPVIIAPTIEHIGDMMAISNIANKDYVTDPGIHRTLSGDSIATMIAGFFGGPPNTTYSEVSGALALLKVFEPVLMTIAAITAIILSFVGKINVLLKTIPAPVMGGIMLLLFGMIAGIGIQTLIKNRVDLSNNKNLIIVSVILTIGIGNLVISYGNFEIGKIGLAGLVGVILNIIIPDEKKEN